MRGRQWVILFGKAEYALRHRSAVGGAAGTGDLRTSKILPASSIPA